MPRKLIRPWKSSRATAPAVDDMSNRKRSDDNYHTRRWTKLSKAFREEHPLCAECERKGTITPTEVVDHIIPVGHHDFWDSDNWQSLCRKCNIIKGNKDKRRYQQGEGGVNL